MHGRGCACDAQRINLHAAAGLSQPARLNHLKSSSSSSTSSVRCHSGLWSRQPDELDARWEQEEAARRQQRQQVCLEAALQGVVQRALGRQQHPCPHPRSLLSLRLPMWPIPLPQQTDNPGSAGSSGGCMATAG